MLNSVDPDETAHMSRLIWIYAVCKSLLLSPVAVKELSKQCLARTAVLLTTDYAVNHNSREKGYSDISFSKKTNFVSTH